MKPPTYAVEIRDTPIGRLTLTASSNRLQSVNFCSLKQLQLRFPKSGYLDGSTQSILTATVLQLGEYFLGNRREFNLDLDISHLTPFQQRVLNLTFQIPYGTTTTYGMLAVNAKSPRAARAVGAAMAGNPIPIIIPCHRVVGSDGSLHGYAAPDGITTKSFLLQLEGLHIVGKKLV